MNKKIFFILIIIILFSLLFLFINKNNEEIVGEKIIQKTPNGEIFKGPTGPPNIKGPTENHPVQK